MDIGIEGSKSDLDEDKHERSVEKGEKMTSLDTKEEGINGEHSGVNLLIEGDKVSAEPIGSPPVAQKVNGDAIEETQRGELSPISIGSSSNSNLEVNSAPAKGYGLKKWRRIRRDMNKDVGGGVDSSLILKRRLSLNESPKIHNDNKVKKDVAVELETPTPSVGSLRSVEAVPLDPEFVQLVAGARFSMGMDSDNSEDRSSKSSTAASSRHEIGFGKERVRTKNVGGRGFSNSLQQKSQKGRGSGVDTSKKIRGDRGRIEKENSQSSVESDLRSSSAGCVRWARGASNVKKSEKSLNFDGEHSDEAQESEDDRSCCYNNNGVFEDLFRETMDPDLLREEIKVKRKNFHPPSGIDPFVESIIMLQAAREALETEIQKIGEIGKATELDDLGDLDDQSEEAEVISSPNLEAHLLETKQKIVHLQNKLEEALATVKAKDLKALELEDIIKRTQSPKDSQGAKSPSLVVDVRNLESELEDLLKKKIQAEVELLIVTRTTQSWKVLVEDQTAFLEKQKSLAGSQAQVMAKLRDAEEKAIKLKEQAEELGSNCKELLGTENVLNLQYKVCKLTFCCFVQLLLLCAAFALFLMQLTPPSYEIVPT